MSSSVPNHEPDLLKIIGQEGGTPTSGSFYIRGNGCNRRSLDSDRIRSYLVANGLTPAPSAEEADHVIVSTCGVSRFHEDDALQMIRESGEAGGRVIVYGCLPAMNPQRMEKEFDGEIVPTQNIDRFDEIFPNFAVPMEEVPDSNVQLREEDSRLKEKLKRVLAERDLFHVLRIYNVVMRLLESGRSRVNRAFPKLFPSPLTTRIPLFLTSPKDCHHSVRISWGCMGNCTYCNIKRAIGRSRSKPVAEILDEVRLGVAQGKFKLDLISSDPGCYGVDIGTSFPELLKSMLAVDERITIELVEGLHPTWMYRYESELVGLVATGRIRLLMVPIQSGSPRMLKLMRRSPDIEAFVCMMNAFKQACPDVRLATQIIVGFPTETDADFEATIELLRRCRIDEVDIFQYNETETSDSLPLTPKVPRSVVFDRMYKIQASLPIDVITHTLHDEIKRN